MVAEGSREAGETLAVSRDVVTPPLAVDTLRTRQAAAAAVETRRTGCRQETAVNHGFYTCLLPVGHSGPPTALCVLQVQILGRTSS